MLFDHVKKFMRKSITFGQTLPSWKQNQPIWTNWNTEKAINEGFKANTYVFSCVNLIARSSASVPWKVYQKTKKGTWEVLEGHPLELLIEKPNPFMNRKDFIERMTQHIYLGGNSVFSKVRAGGVVAELWNLPPDAVKPVPHPQTFIDHYLYEQDGNRFKIDPADILHNMFTDPSNLYWGISPLMAGARVIDSDVEAVKFNKVALQNRALTDGVFTFNQNLTREQWEQAREMVREQHQGHGNARQPWVLGNDAKWQQMSMTPAEMDFLESRRFTREEICSLFQVPPPLVGIYDKANYKIETARKIFWLDTIIPFLEDLKASFNLSLTPEFGQNIELDFDLSNVEALQENFKEKIDNAKQLWSMGVPFNQVNQMLELGFDDIEGGETGFLPANLIPANMDFGNMFNDQANDESEEADETDESEETDEGEKRVKSSSPRKKKELVHHLHSEEHKTFFWKTQERRRSPWYMNLTRKSAQLFKEEGQAVAEAFKKNGLQGALKEVDKHQKNWGTFLQSSWTSMIEDFGSEQYENLKSTGGFRLTKNEEEEEDYFDPWDVTIQDYIRRTTGSKIKLIQQFSKEQVNQLVQVMREPDADGFVQTVDQIAKGIVTKYDDFARYRTYRIARTEVVGANSYANYQSASQLSENIGADIERTWVSSRDSRVRDSHQAGTGVDGQTVGMNERFSNGLMFPADYEADKPSETIQCRCSVSYSVKR